MSHVDTSIGFSLRSEPPSLAVALHNSGYDLEALKRAQLEREMLNWKVLSVTYPIVAVIGNSITSLLDGKWEGWSGVAESVAIAPFLGVGMYAFMYLFLRAKLERRSREIVAKKLDSPVVHITAEGQWVTFRFASGHEFVDRWDRLLRFKSAPEFTEFEFPANPPIIIPTMAIPVETLRTISLFCTAERIPSETKR